jgi:hypothetical protein
MALLKRVMNILDSSMPFEEGVDAEANNDDIEASARIEEVDRHFRVLLGLSVADWTLVLCNITS